MRLMLVVLTVLTAAAIVGGASAEPPTTAATAQDDAELQKAYDTAWEVSNQIEEWSNFIVDGIEADRPTEADWERAFDRITEVIRTLCASGEVECKYPEQGY